MNPSIGRIVRYHGFEHGPHAAIVADVLTDEGGKTLCNLFIIPKTNAANPGVLEGVPYVETPEGLVYGWNWPPRE